jgi:NAD(P)-dependent dehydrogenase (short-subunit alcohol dehydrogenase family)
MVDTAVDFGGKLDILVNNAGMDPRGSITKLDPGLWRRVIDVNLTGPFLLMKASIPHMIKAGGGSIINIASLAGTRCLPAMAAYCSSKAGLIMLTQQAALDYGVHKIRSNVICPGGVKTDMVDNSLGSLAKTLNTDVDGAIRIVTSGTPLRRVAVPQEISGVCSFLAGDDSSFMTGAVLMVDGGSSVVCVAGAVLTNAGVKCE